MKIDVLSYRYLYIETKNTYVLHHAEIILVHVFTARLCLEGIEQASGAGAWSRLLRGVGSEAGALVEGTGPQHGNGVFLPRGRELWIDAVAFGNETSGKVIK